MDTARARWAGTRFLQEVEAGEKEAKKAATEATVEELHLFAFEASKMLRIAVQEIADRLPPEMVNR